MKPVSRETIASEQGDRSESDSAALLAQIDASRAEFDAGKSVRLTRALLRTVADGAKSRARRRSARLLGKPGG
jgi:hypothetical protein